MSIFEDVVLIAKELLGKYLFTKFNGKLTGGIITETEAYEGVTDRASHAFDGRRTQRTEIMYSKGGVAYVYLCYGIHHLFNVVTNLEDVPHAILVRAIEPVKGINIMLYRMKKKKQDYTIGKGPGNVSKALGLKTMHTGFILSGNEIYIADDGKRYKNSEIITSPRIGVDYAAEDAFLPYRFYVSDNPNVNGKKTK